MFWKCVSLSVPLMRPIISDRRILFGCPYAKSPAGWGPYRLIFGNGYKGSSWVVPTTCGVSRMTLRRPMQKGRSCEGKYSTYSLELVYILLFSFRVLQSKAPQSALDSGFWKQFRVCVFEEGFTAFQARVEFAGLFEVVLPQCPTSTY